MRRLRSRIGWTFGGLAIVAYTLLPVAWTVSLSCKGKKLVLSTALAIGMFPTIALVSPLFDMWRSLGIYAGSSPDSRPAQ